MRLGLRLPHACVYGLDGAMQGLRVAEGAGLGGNPLRDGGLAAREHNAGLTLCAHVQAINAQSLQHGAGGFAAGKHQTLRVGEDIAQRLGQPCSELRAFGGVELRVRANAYYYVEPLCHLLVQLLREALQRRVQVGA